MRAGGSATGGRSLSDPVAAAKQKGARHPSTVAGATGRYATHLPDRGRNWWRTTAQITGEGSCTRRVGRGKLSGMSSSRTSVRRTRTRVAAVLAALIRIVGGLIVLILVAHIVLTLGDANPANSITRLVAYWADRLQLGFRGLFAPENPKTRVVVDYGLPAAVWLVATWILVRVIRRIGG